MHLELTVFTDVMNVFMGWRYLKTEQKFLDVHQMIMTRSGDELKLNSLPGCNLLAAILFIYLYFSKSLLDVQIKQILIKVDVLFIKKTGSSVCVVLEGVQGKLANR